MKLGDRVLDKESGYIGIITEILPEESPSLPKAYRITWYGYNGESRLPTGSSDIPVKGRRLLKLES